MTQARTAPSTPSPVSIASPGRIVSRGDAAQLFAGPGEMRARCRDFDWSTTPLGPVDTWSQRLCAAVDLLMASRNPMFLWWGTNLVQIYNDAYRPSFGENGRHPRALGMCALDCWTDIWADISPQIMQVMTTGEPTWHEDQYLPIERNGTLEDVWWTYSYSPVRDDDGTIGGTLVVCQETTSRMLAAREHEQLLRALEVERSRLEFVFQRAPSFLAVLRGPEHVFELVNDAYYKLVGHRTLIGRAAFDALPEVRDQGFNELLDRVLTTREPFIGREMSLMVARNPGAAPEERFVDLTYMPLIEGEGEAVGIIAHGADVTEQVRSRREVERLLSESERLRAEAEAARSEAESANRAKSDFLAVMSHELRTPLNAIGGYTNLLEMGIRGPVTEEQSHDLHRIQSSQRHLLGLINEVLNYAKLEAGSVQFALTDVSLRDVVRAAEALVAPQARAKELSLVVGDCDPALTARADREKVRQVLVNLLSNAIKFTDADGHVHVSCGRTGACAWMRVQDSGIGIAAEQLESIFDPFVQVRSDLTRPHDGAGLGLAISRDLARGMGGELTVESRLGEGSVFTLTLPCTS